MMGWIGFDLDGTLAEYDGWKGPTHIGEPIPTTVELLKDYLRHGIVVKIFTARVCSAQKAEDRLASEAAIKAWCVKHIGHELLVTAEKDYQMMDLYDDRCHRVEINTGRILA